LRSGLLCVLSSCDRSFISAASIAAGVVTSAASLRFREFFAGDVGSRFAHATAFNATYQQTPELPENHPTIVGSVWEQEILFMWMAILFCTAVAVAQCLASSARSSRFKRYILGLLRRAAFVAGFAARTSRQRSMSQPQHQHLSRFSVKHAVSVDTPCTYNSRTTL